MKEYEDDRLMKIYGDAAQAMNFAIANAKDICKSSIIEARRVYDAAIMNAAKGVSK